MLKSLKLNHLFPFFLRHRDVSSRWSRLFVRAYQSSHHRRPCWRCSAWDCCGAKPLLPRDPPTNQARTVFGRATITNQQKILQRSQGPGTSKACKDDSSAGSTDTFAFKCANVDGLLFDNETVRRNTLDDRRAIWTSLGIGTSRYSSALMSSLDSQRRGLVTTALHLLD